MSGPDYIVELSSRPSDQPVPATPGGSSSSLRGRPWLAVHWKCCQVYSRIYRSRDGSAYAGTCPRCGRAVRASVGEGGTSARFFTAE